MCICQKRWALYAVQGRIQKARLGGDGRRLRGEGVRGAEGAEPRRRRRRGSEELEDISHSPAD